MAQNKCMNPALTAEHIADISAVLIAADAWAQSREEWLTCPAATLADAYRNEKLRTAHDEARLVLAAAVERWRSRALPIILAGEEV